MAPPIILVRGGRFHQVVQAVLAGDGVDAAAKPSFDFDATLAISAQAQAIVGVASVIAKTQYGMRVTSAEISIDQGIDFPRGTRLAILTAPSSAQSLQGWIQQYSAGVGMYVPEMNGATVNGCTGAVIPDLEIPTVNPAIDQFTWGFGPINPPSGNVICMVDILRPGTSAFGASNGALVQMSPDGTGFQIFWGEGPGALDVPADSSVAALFLAYRAQSGARPVNATGLRGMTVRGSVHGYALTKEQAQVREMQFGTPGRFDNALGFGGTPSHP